MFEPTQPSLDHAVAALTDLGYVPRVEEWAVQIRHIADPDFWLRCEPSLSGPSRVTDLVPGTRPLPQAAQALDAALQLAGSDRRHLKFTNVSAGSPQGLGEQVKTLHEISGHYAKRARFFLLNWEVQELNGKHCAIAKFGN